ncbi:hypothetical protein LIER_24209 [Lithospermum erythrorhizon]|uniref:Uncharacterized protein n=1 Tax=Lithospermum erythrorhizon TaxID=34254 RepID=A0AAV3R0J0_LITER
MSSAEVTMATNACPQYLGIHSWLKSSVDSYPAEPVLQLFEACDSPLGQPVKLLEPRSNLDGRKGPAIHSAIQLVEGHLGLELCDVFLRIRLPCEFGEGREFQPCWHDGTPYTRLMLVKSVHIHQVPLGFGTNTTLSSHVGNKSSRIAFSPINFPTSSRMASPFSSEKVRFFCLTGLSCGSRKTGGPIRMDPPLAYPFVPKQRYLDTP